jgi:hypothetical protein
MKQKLLRCLNLFIALFNLMLAIYWIIYLYEKADSIGAQIVCWLVVLLFCFLTAINIDNYVKAVKDSDEDGFTLSIEKHKDISDEEVCLFIENLFRNQIDKDNNDNDNNDNGEMN